MGVFTSEDFKFYDLKRKILPERNLSSKKYYDFFMSKRFIEFIRDLCAYAEPEDIREVLERSNEYRLNFHNLFKGHLVAGEVGFTHDALLANNRNFRYLIVFGGRNEYYPKACCLYLEKAYRYSKKEDRVMYRKILEDFYQNNLPNNRISFRVYQLLFLFVRGHLSGAILCEDELSLMLLWEAIPDPLLTVTDFLLSLPSLDPPDMQKLMQAWDWYCELMEVKEPEKCPRTLLHLSRCAIRRRLSDCCNLPSGIIKLPVSRLDKEYLTIIEEEY